MMVTAKGWSMCLQSQCVRKVEGGIVFVFSTTQLSNQEKVGSCVVQNNIMNTTDMVKAQERRNAFTSFTFIVPSSVTSTCLSASLFSTPFGFCLLFVLLYSSCMPPFYSYFFCCLSTSFVFFSFNNIHFSLPHISLPSCTT